MKIHDVCYIGDVCAAIKNPNIFEAQLCTKCQKYHVTIDKRQVNQQLVDDLQQLVGSE